MLLITGNELYLVKDKLNSDIKDYKVPNPKIEKIKKTVGSVMRSMLPVWSNNTVTILI